MDKVSQKQVYFTEAKMDSVMRSLKVLQGLFLLKKITWIEANEKY